MLRLIMRCIATVVALSALFGAPATAQPPRCCSTEDAARIDSVLSAEMRRRHAPGVAIAVAQHGRVVYSRALGVRSVETRDPMTTSTLMRIGSITKSITGLAASALVDANQLDLDAPISRYARGLSPALAQLTMRRLLSHTAGLINEGAGDGSHDREALARRVRAWTAAETFAPPGDVYSYSSPGYWLAGHVIAEIAKTSYDSAARRLVLDPLGMSRSTYSPFVALTHPLALDHRAVRDSIVVVRPFPDDASTWPSGSLFSSADELIRFGMALADSGRVEGRQRIGVDVVRLASTRQAATPGPDSASCGYGLGVSVCTQGGVVMFSHYGFRGGSGAVLTVVPSMKTAIVILANGPGAIMRNTEQAVLRIAGVTSTDDASPTPAKATLARDRLGVYAAGPDTLTLFARGDSVFYRYLKNAAQPVAAYTNETIAVLDARGEPEQQFLFVRGRRTRALYLHDGLNAFRKVR